MRNIQPPGCTDCQHKNQLFCGLNHNDKKFLSFNKRVHVFGKKQKIFNEGNDAFGIYCVYQGKIKLTKLGDDGKEQIIRLVGPGEVLGHRSMLSNTPHNTSAVTIEDCTLCYLPKSAFVSKLTEKNVLAMNTIRLVSENLREVENKLMHISQKSVRQRVAQTLLLLKNKFGLENDDETLNVAMTRKEIGEMAGIATETSIRALSDLKKEKLIGFDHKKIKILDMDKMNKVVAMDN